MCSTAHRRSVGAIAVHGFAVGCQDCECVASNATQSGMPDDLHLEFFGTRRRP